MKHYLTTKELAEHLNLATITLELWRARGEGPPYLKLGRSIRYDPTAVEAWIASRAVTTSSK